MRGTNQNDSGGGGGEQNAARGARNPRDKRNGRTARADVTGAAAPSKATQARLAAGLTLAAAAKRARICPAYLQRVERAGASFALAQRLAALYGCPIDHFLVFGRRSAQNRPPRNSDPAGGTPSPKREKRADPENSDGSRGDSPSAPAAAKGIIP